MTGIPNLARVELGDAGALGNSAAMTDPWRTPEGIEVKPVYGREDMQDLDFLNT